MNLKNIISLFVTASFLWSCDDDGGNSKPDYDFSQILVNVADNITIERYSDLSTETGGLKVAAATFVSNPDQTNLDALQSAFIASYEAWQGVSYAHFGYGGNSGLRGVFNTFPTDTAEIRTIFIASNPTYTQASYVDATGFPGLDFSLFFETDNEVLDRFTTGANGPGAKDYLTGVVAIIDDHAKGAEAYWQNNTDNYKEAFKADQSKAVGSAFSNLVNEFVWDAEFMKNYQLAYPAGKYTLDILRPELAEALYSKENLALLKAHLEYLRKLYKGEDALGTDGKGFDDYLLYLGTTKDGVALNTLILNTFSDLDSDINQLTGDLNLAINNQPALINDIFLNMKKLVSYFKVDMTTAFGVQITYTDNDGD